MHILIAAHLLIKDNYSIYSYKNFFHDSQFYIQYLSHEKTGNNSV